MKFMQITINGLKCECVDSTSDSFEKTVVEHRIIGYSGPFLEDAGLYGRTLDIDTLWHNENYNGHEIFLREYATKKGVDMIIHPVYGWMTGKIRNVRIVHNSREKYAAHISISFIEQGAPWVKVADSLLFGTVAANTEAVINQIGQTAANAINRAGGLINRMNDVRSTMAHARALAATRMGVFNSAVDAIIYPSTLAGEMLDTAVSIVDGVGANVDKLVESPSSAIFGVRQNLLFLHSRVKKSTNVGGDILADLILSYMLFNECLLVAKVNDEYTAQIAAQSFAQAAQTRAGLASAAKAMLKFVNETIKNDLENTTQTAAAANLTAKEVDNTLANANIETELNVEGQTSIFRILLERKIPVDMASDVCQRNQIENPNKVQGRIFVPIV